MIRIGLLLWVAWLAALAGAAEAPAGAAAVLLNDVTRVTPAEAVSGTPGPGQWLLRDFQGQAVLAADGTQALPPLTVPVHRPGWYDIYLSLYTYGSPIDDAEWEGIHVRLSSDAWYTHVYGGRTGLGSGWELGSLDEFFWRRAELSQEDILVYQPYGRFFRPRGGLGAVRLVPVSPEQLAADRNRRERRLLDAPPKQVGGMLDFWSWAMVTRKTAASGTEEVIDNHRNAGLDSVFFQINADGQVHYHSRIAQWVDQAANQDPRTDMGQAAAAVLQTHDPLRVASERAHQAGLRFFAWFRVTNEQSMDNDRLDYMRRFRHLRVRGADNQPTRWPSLAHPEVRDYKLAVLQEVLAGYPQVDGLLLDFLRTMPVVGYDPPLVEAYAKAYGVNPLEDVAERSAPRWKQFRAEAVTGFVRAVRQMAAAAGERAGRKVQVAVRVTPRDNLWKGLDVEGWVRDGLVDLVIPSNYSMFNPPFAVAPFVEMVRGTGCQVYAGVNPFFAGGDDDAEHHPNRHEQEVAAVILQRVTQGCPTPREYALRVLDHYAEGADGVVLYESETLTSPVRLYPAREGMLPLFRAMARPRDLADYLAGLGPD